MKKTWCFKCGKEQEIVDSSATINRDRSEKKVEGRCKRCGEYLCRILSTR